MKAALRRRLEVLEVINGRTPLTMAYLRKIDSLTSDEVRSIVNDMDTKRILPPWWPEFTEAEERWVAYRCGWDYQPANRDQHSKIDFSDERVS